MQTNLGLNKSQETFELPQAVRTFGVCRLLDEQWLEISNKGDGDVTIEVSSKTLIKSKKSLLSLNSTYFKNMLNNDFMTPEDLILRIKSWNDTVTKVFVKFLEYDVLFVPISFEQEDWIELTLLSKYYHVKRLTNICEYELIYGMNPDDSLDLLKFALQNKLKSLESHCV